MTISIWRYSHLALAVSSFLLLALAAVTGIILAFQPVSEKLQPFRVDQFDEISLSETLPALKKEYAEINALSVDHNQFVLIQGVDLEGENIQAYIDPRSGKIIGKPAAKSPFFEWVTALHRSLFLKETGRFLIGVTAFILTLITVSGTILIIQRQRGVKRFFTKIIRDHFAQYYHVVLGRLLLIPIFLVALTGTYLSLARFEIVKAPKVSAEVDFDAIQDEPKKALADFEVFQNVHLSEVSSIEFPFSEDVEDYFTLKLKDREVTVNQVTGDILSEIKYPAATTLTELSLDLHTGRTNAIWAVILAVASANILFFIYSGFAITLRRRAGRTKNRFSAAESEYILLIGSENGSTFAFANAIHQQLIKQGKKSFVTELNNYAAFPKASHLVVFTATYGLGDAPTNAKQFEKQLVKFPQQQPVKFSVVGFGSHSYPAYCKFAYETDHLLAKQDWASPLLEIHTVNDKSPEEFGQWATNWAQHAEVQMELSGNLIAARKERMQQLTVASKTVVTGPGDAFIITFLPKRSSKFTSGDLLAIYPAGDHRERLYSIGKVNGAIQLSVKLHAGGLGSEYLYQLNVGDTVQARLVSNAHFHLPEKAEQVIMISNGTGIAPFLGMIDQQKNGSAYHLYCGFRDQHSFDLYKNSIHKNLTDKKLSNLHIAYSREGEKQYVRDLLAKDQELVSDTLQNGGTIMLCGSLAMQNNVIDLLEEICSERLGKDVSHYQARGQVLMDCY